MLKLNWSQRIPWKVKVGGIQLLLWQAVDDDDDNIKMLPSVTNPLREIATLRHMPTYNV